MVPGRRFVYDALQAKIGGGRWFRSRLYDRLRHSRAARGFSGSRLADDDRDGRETCARSHRLNFGFRLILRMPIPATEIPPQRVAHGFASMETRGALRALHIEDSSVAETNAGFLDGQAGHPDGREWCRRLRAAIAELRGGKPGHRNHRLATERLTSRWNGMGRCAAPRETGLSRRGPPI